MQVYKGTEKLKATMIKKYGSESAWKAIMRERGSIGGKKSRGGGFTKVTQNMRA